MVCWMLISSGKFPIFGSAHTCVYPNGESGGKSVSETYTRSEFLLDFFILGISCWSSCSNPARSSVSHVHLLFRWSIYYLGNESRFVLLIWINSSLCVGRSKTKSFGIFSSLCSRSSSPSSSAADRISLLVVATSRVCYIESREEIGEVKQKINFSFDLQ